MQRTTLAGQKFEHAKRQQAAQQAAFVFGDYGSGVELLRLYEAVHADLAKSRVAVNCYMDSVGKLSQLLERRNVYHYFLDPQGDHHAPDIIVVGTSQEKRACPEAWTRFGRTKGIPVVWLNGTHGAAVVASRGGQLVPDVVFAVDDADAALTRKLLPGVAVVTCGKPTHDKWEKRITEQAESRSLVRLALGVPEEVRLVTYWAGRNMVRTLSHVRALVGPWMDMESVRLAFRFPYVQGEERQELEHVVGRVSRVMSRRVCPPFGPSHGVVMDELLLASDLTVTDWDAPQGILSVALGIPNITPLFPSHMRPGGLPAEKFFAVPQSYGGASVLVKQAGDLASQIEAMLDNLPKARQALEAARQPFRPYIAPGAVDRMRRALVERMNAQKAA